FLLLLVFTATVFAQTPLTKPTKAELKNAEIEYELDADAVVELLRKCYNDILKGRKDAKALTTMKYASYSSKINVWLKYRWFIADTGLSKKWLKKVQDLLLYMRKTQGYINNAQYNRNTQTAKYQQALKYFAVAYGRFVKLIKKPVKVSGKLQRQVKGKKLVWQKNMRKKYKIEKKSTNGTN
ncbi:MAG: hypothetical protein KOO69_00660, partial [Victivallales bacterium]|nr:hypothetical protein [Victivallales bacterium]